MAQKKRSTLPSYNSIYQKIRRRKIKVDSLDKKKRGYKSERSSIYKEIVELNRDLRKAAKKEGKKVSPKLRLKRVSRDVESKTETYSEVVWRFEAKFNAYLRAGAFKKIVFVNTGRTMYLKKSKPSSILEEYDLNRNMAYGKAFASTPAVDVIEDYGRSILTLEFVS